MDLKNDLSMVIIIISIIICYYYYYYYLLLLLKTFVKRKIRIDTPNALSQQLNRCLSLALKTSSEANTWPNCTQKQCK